MLDAVRTASRHSSGSFSWIFVRRVSTTLKRAKFSLLSSPNSSISLLLTAVSNCVFDTSRRERSSWAQLPAPQMGTDRAKLSRVRIHRASFGTLRFLILSFYPDGCQAGRFTEVYNFSQPCGLGKPENKFRIVPIHDSLSQPRNRHAISLDHSRRIQPTRPLSIG